MGIPYTDPPVGSTGQFSPREESITYAKVFKEWCLYQFMKLIIKHIIYALNSLVVAERGLDGASQLPYDTVNDCYQDERGSHALSSRKMRSVQVRALAHVEVGLSEPRCLRGMMHLTRVCT